MLHYHAGCTAHFLLLLIRVSLWLAAFLPRMPLECRETGDWLRPAWSNMSAPLYNATICSQPQTDTYEKQYRISGLNLDFDIASSVAIRETLRMILFT
uniref:Secreted protein n=1 Tax=Mesocestoides corti TaxID=53468 RepID=A0A5K3FJ97_MESCO